jgi:uncharacterized protein (TIGR02058 family)
MAAKPYLIEIGTGVDLHGSDDTVAATRAVADAIGRSGLLFLRHLGLRSAEQIVVEVTIATPHPDRVDTSAVAATLPVGRVSARAGPGGMLADTGTPGDPVLVAVAAVRVSVERDDEP